MKEGWKIKSLGEICKIELGKTPYRGNPSFWDENRSTNNVWLSIADLLNCDGLIVSDSKEYLSNKGAKNSKIVKSGTLLVSFKLTIGRLAFAGKDLFTNEAIAALTIYYEDEILKNYLFYYFTFFDWDKTTDGEAKIKGKTLNKEKLRKILISIPPLQTQQRVISILDEDYKLINQAKANIERNLQNAKELFQSELNSIFTNKGDGWVEKRLSEVFEMKPQKKEARDSLTETDLVTFLPMEDLGIETKKICPTKVRTLKEVGGSYTYFANNDVLLAKITPCFENGKIGIADNLVNGIGFGSSEYIVFRSKREVNPEFLYYFLSRKLFREQGKALMTGAVGHKRVSKDWIDNHILTFPKSMVEQSKIIGQLDALSLKTKNLEEKYQQKLSQLEVLKKSILQKAFSGELKLNASKPKESNRSINIANITTTDLHAGIIALSIKQHEEADTIHTFHHVKSEKIVHLIESHLQINLDRNPIKGAAGPNDHQITKKIESRARKAGFFYVEKVGDVINYRKGSQFNKIVDKTVAALGNLTNAVLDLIDLMAPLTTQQAEIVATVYAGWNNLLLEGIAISNELIVTEARENWHVNKLNIPRDKFFSAIDWMKEKNLVPKGNGKKVISKG